MLLPSHSYPGPWAAAALLPGPRGYILSVLLLVSSAQLLSLSSQGLPQALCPGALCCSVLFGSEWLRALALESNRSDPNPSSVTHYLRDFSSQVSVPSPIKWT